MTGLLIAGTSSDAGKSLVVTGICRALANRGIDVAPYKAQNMSNNSMVTADGGEIGRAQYLQATAAGVRPSTAMNPVLLKPGTDRTSFVVLRGRPAGQLRAGEYATKRRELAQAAHAAYRELAAAHEIVICEGAGSPAEINLRAGDYTNFGLAREFEMPVVLVGDIDRGGVLASLYGTWALAEPGDRELLAGYVINKFRGDAGVLKPGLTEISRRTGLPCFGVLPWLTGVWLDGEDTLEVGRWRREFTSESPGEQLRVAVVRLPRVSNVTDVDTLAQEPGVEVLVTTSAQVCQDADLVVLPGSRSTLSDLAWLSAQGIAEVLVERHQRGRPILGICGGYQMLGHRLRDGIEGSLAAASGLGLLPLDVSFGSEKVLRRPTGTWQGVAVTGYEIHHGVPQPRAEAEEFLEGQRVGNTFGTMWHGALEGDSFRRSWLRVVAEAAGSAWCPKADAASFASRREQLIETLAQAVVENLDLDELLRLAQL